MSRTAGNDASQSASTEVSGGIELNAAFALFAAAGHLGGSFFGCHCAALLNWSLMELEKSTDELVGVFGRSNGLCTQEVAGRFVVAGKLVGVGEEPGHPPAISLVVGTAEISV